MKYLIYITSALLLLSCQQNTKDSEKETKEQGEKQEHKRPSAYNNGKFINNENGSFLYGGKDSSDHFDISNSVLIPEQFHYGIGREVFPALIEPEFTSIKEVEGLWEDSDRFLIAHAGDDVKAYSVKDLTRHEVVNDVLNGQPIMAAYCVLADLGAIYQRNYGDDTLTFALSGYTYYDENVWDGVDGFVLWDRETESLWWPLVGKGVSGPLKNVKLLEMDEAHWEDTTWGEIKKKYPNAKILISDQDYERPTSWRKIENVENIKANFSE